MDKEQEKWAIFWCELLTPVIYDEIEPELTNQFLRKLAKTETRFPDGRVGKPSLSTLRRKLNRYRLAGFDALARKGRSDRGKSRNIGGEVIEKAIVLKKEQPRRSPKIINQFLEEIYGTTIPRSTLYRHLKQANATRIKLGVLRKKVRKRWSRDHTHDLWVGDFEDGPYVLEKGSVVPTYLSVFIDCHSRWCIEARYYFRQNLDVLIDSFIRALSINGAPLTLYVDRAKIYLSNGLRAACYRLNIKLLHRPPRDPPPGGLVERLILMAFERECTESYWEGHARAFEFFGGVANRISYDNSKVMVIKIIGAHKRELTDGFLKLQSHYLFKEHFCRVARPNEKGVVEGVVKFSRSNFMVPVPQVKDFDELNAMLADKCRQDLDRRLRGKNGSKKELLNQEQAAFLPLPVTAFDACRKQPTRANSLSLVRFDDNDYSVPVAYAHHEILIKGYVDRVVLCHHHQVVAEHRRSWDKEGIFFAPRHYLALLERKPGALNYALPLADLKLDPCFDTLHRRLEAEQHKQGHGTREFIKVLRLLEDHSQPRLTQAVKKALRIGAHNRDAVAQFLIPRASWFPLIFMMDGCEHLRAVKVQKPDVAAYGALVKEVPCE